MTEKRVTVKELSDYLLDLIKEGYGDNTVELSINYDNCDHIQPLNEVHVCRDCKYIDWITLRGRSF